MPQGHLIQQGRHWRQRLLAWWRATQRRRPSVDAFAQTPARLLRDTSLVLAAARRVEPDRVRRLAWYREDPIAALGSCTAEQLVAAGEAARVIALIRVIDAMEHGS
ncbi:hypothetical protein [Luteibacter jiangsuensis]